MKLFLTSVSVVLALSSQANTHQKLSRNDYVELWKTEAIRQMKEHNIPASITLAQGILESGSGNSELAVKGKNHFGIKCHGWTGKKMYMDDDAKGECFRVYKSAEQSYEDHSLFLNKYDRYAFLFDLDLADYKAWAKGLRKAGYATNPQYPQLLIKLIEDLELDQYDKGMVPEIVAQPELIAANESMSNKHDVAIKGKRSKYVVVKKGDTFYKIAQEFGLTLGQLYRYNDFDPKKDFLEEGDIVYINKKRVGTFFKKKKEITLKEDASLNELSQEYGIKASSLARINGFARKDVVLSAGETVTLR
ncbi:MAG: glucosaminidase domain-containing protein [Flavobacteriales bacterium]|nr:glucosaminidase domain-containing protein [Flavobacteriales bacterium]PIE86553.1 MAG: N-acetylmuramoyl-L-alanine amidase [Bacteroidota bacterium]